MTLSGKIREFYLLNGAKTISGRLALRVLGDDARAREAVSLGVVAAYLRARGELDDSILIPVDSHPELFAPRARRKRTGTPRLRCDLIRVKFLRTRLVATFIEVKSRAASGQSEELLNRIVDQIEATEPAEPSGNVPTVFSLLSITRDMAHRKTISAATSVCARPTCPITARNAALLLCILAGLARKKWSRK